MIIGDAYNGDLTIDDNLTITGIVFGNIIVQPNALMNVNGIVNGTIEVQTNAKVKIYGVINGNVKNEGGFLSVLGTVNGMVFENAGITKIHPKAIVTG
jgi:cytoskeletal protein CcmA (bactofilin family)